MAFNSEPQWQQEEIKPSRLKSCWFVGLAVVMIMALLASSAASVAWLFTREGQETAVTAPQSNSAALNKDVPVAKVTPPVVAAEPVPETAVAPLKDQLNRIALINDEGQIETVAPDGSDRHILTDEAITFQFPAWSPDDQQIAAIGSSFSGGGIYVLQDEDNSQSNITELYNSISNNPFYLYWAPDSRQISFLASHPDGIGLNMVEVVGDSENRVIATGSPFYWNWAEDGEQMLIHSGSNTNDARLVMIDDEGEDRTSDVPLPGRFQAPGISVNGRYWAYSQLKAGGNSWLIVHDTESEAQIEERHAGSLALSWSSNGDKIAYISSGNNDVPEFWGPLRLLDAATGNVRLLSPDTVLAFFWSPDGKQIAYITPAIRDLGGIEVNNTFPSAKNRSTKQATTNPTAQGSSFQFNLSVVDVETGQGLRLLDFRPPSLFLSQFLPFFDQYALSHRLWSPDSDALVLPIVVGDDNQVVVVPTTGGQTRQIGNGTIGFWSQN